MEDRLGPDDEVAPHSPGADLGLGGELEDRPSSEGLELFPCPTDPGAQVLHPGASAADADLGPNGLAASTPELAVVALGHGGVATFAGGDLTARRAAQQLRSTLSVEDAHDAGAAAHDLDQSGAVPGLGGGQLTGVDDLDAGPTLAFGPARRRQQRRGGKCFEGGSGRDEDARDVGARRARSSATSRACQVGACSCCRDSSCSSRTIDRGWSGQRRPGGGSCTEHGGPAGPGHRPLLREHRDRDPGTPQTQAEVPHRTGRWPDHERGPSGRGRDEQRIRVRRRREPHDRDGATQRLVGQGGEVPGRDGGRRGGGPSREAGKPPHQGIGRGGAQQRHGASGPAPRCPLGQIEDLGGWAPAAHLRDRSEDDARRWFDGIRHHPTPDPSAVQHDPDHGADPHLVGHGRGNDVVEALVDARHVWPDPHHPGMPDVVSRNVRRGRRDGGPQRSRGPAPGGGRSAWRNDAVGAEVEARLGRVARHRRPIP